LPTSASDIVVLFIIMLLPVYTGRSSVCSFVCPLPILSNDRLFSKQRTSCTAFGKCLRRMGMEQSTFEVIRSKVKVTRRRS